MKNSEHPKIKSKKIFLFGILIYSTYLVGCDSGISGQIEKCVQAAITSNGPYKNNQEKAETEVIARSFCLRAASGKD